MVELLFFDVILLTIALPFKPCTPDGPFKAKSPLHVSHAMEPSFHLSVFLSLFINHTHTHTYTYTERNLLKEESERESSNALAVIGVVE